MSGMYHRSARAVSAKVCGLVMWPSPCLGLFVSRMLPVIVNVDGYWVVFGLLALCTRLLFNYSLVRASGPFIPKKS